MILHSVFLLDDDDDLRTALSESIGRSCDCDVLALRSFKEMTLYSGLVLQTKIAFLDVNLGNGEKSGIDAYEWLRNEGYRGQIYFLTGHAGSHPLVAKAIQCGHAMVLHKPVPTELLCRDVRGAIATNF